MTDPADPAETPFQRLLNREILVSERRRMLAWRPCRPSSSF